MKKSLTALIVCVVFVQASSKVYAIDPAASITIYNPTDPSAPEMLPWVEPSSTIPSKPEQPPLPEPVPEPLGGLGSQEPKLL